MSTTAPGVKLLILYDQQSQTQMILQSLVILGAAAKQPNNTDRKFFGRVTPQSRFAFCFFFVCECEQEADRRHAALLIPRRYL